MQMMSASYPGWVRARFQRNGARNVCLLGCIGGQYCAAVSAVFDPLRKSGCQSCCIAQQRIQLCASLKSSSPFSAARQPPGRSRRTRSNWQSCRPSGSWPRARLHPMVNGSPRSCNDCANSTGWRAAPSRSSIAGRKDATSASPRSWPSSSGLMSISLSRMQPQQPSQQSRRLQSYRLCSQRRRTRSAQAWSRVLAQPGGNVTGLSNQSTDLAAKRLEILREFVPNLHRLAIMGQCR